MPSISFRPALPSLALPILALPLFALAACGEADQPEVEPEAPSSEMIAVDPAEPAVPVALPTAAMTNVPPTEGAAAAP